MKRIYVDLTDILTAGDRPHQHLEARYVARIVPKAFIIKVPKGQLFAIVVFSTILLTAIVGSLTHVEASRLNRGYATEELPRRPPLPGVMRDQQEVGDPRGVMAFENLGIVRATEGEGMLSVTYVVGFGQAFDGFLGLSSLAAAPVFQHFTPHALGLLTHRSDIESVCA